MLEYILIIPQSFEPDEVDLEEHLFRVRRPFFGAFRFHSKQIFLSNTLVHNYLGFEEVDEGIWNIVYYNTVVGRLNRKTGKITGHDKVQNMSLDFC